MLRRFLAAVLFVLAPSAAGTAEIVRVGGYEFPPFVETRADGPAGLTLDLIDLFNRSQSDYEFRFVSVSARRRYGDLQDGRFDAMFFESPDWEWAARGLPVDFSDVFLTGGEVFIAQATPGRGQDYFDNLKGKRLVGILGYHYRFAGFDADPERLARAFDIKLVNSHASGIEMVALGRKDIAVVTDAYLWAYLSRNPAVKNKLLVSDRHDQDYHHRVLVRRGGPVTVDRINALLARLGESGALDTLWRKAGVVR